MGQKKLNSMVSYTGQLKYNNMYCVHCIQVYRVVNKRTSYNRFLKFLKCLMEIRLEYLDFFCFCEKKNIIYEGIQN